MNKKEKEIFKIYRKRLTIFYAAIAILSLITFTLVKSMVVIWANLFFLVLIVFFDFLLNRCPKCNCWLGWNSWKDFGCTGFKCPDCKTPLAVD